MCISRHRLASLYNVTCMYFFMTGDLTLDNQLVWTFLKVTSSVTLITLYCLEFFAWSFFNIFYILSTQRWILLLDMGCRGLSSSVPETRSNTRDVILGENNQVLKFRVFLEYIMKFSLLGSLLLLWQNTYPRGLLKLSNWRLHPLSEG